MKSWHSKGTEMPVNILACSVFVKSVKTKFEYHQDCTVSAILREHSNNVSSVKNPLKAEQLDAVIQANFGLLTKTSSEGLEINQKIQPSEHQQ